MHPTAIPGADKLRLISESARGEGGRVWVPKDKSDKRSPRDIPEKERDYFLERMYPGYGNLVPRDIASRALFKTCFHEGRGIFNAETGQERERGLPRPHPQGREVPPQQARRHPRDLREVRRRRPVQEPDEGLPRRALLDGRPLGGLRARRARLAQGGLAAQPLDQHPRPLRRRRGRLPVPRRQPPRRQLAALVHLGRHGHRPRRRQLPEEPRRAAPSTCPSPSSRRPRRRRRTTTSASSSRTRTRRARRTPTCSTRSSATPCSATAPSSATTRTLDKVLDKIERARRAREEREDARHLAAGQPGRPVRPAPARTCSSSRASSPRARGTATSRAARTTSPRSPSATTRSGCAPRSPSTSGEGEREVRPRASTTTSAARRSTSPTRSTPAWWPRASASTSRRARRAPRPRASCLPQSSRRAREHG